MRESTQQPPPAPLPRPGHKIEHFSYSLFFLTVGLTLVGLCAALWLIAPATWQLQWSAPFWRFAVAYVAISFLNCFIEYFFHRYVLHQPAISGLGQMYRQHTLHHALTHIVRKPIPGSRNDSGGRHVLYVENKFPITEIEQGEGSFFPWFSLAAFAVLLSPVLALAQWYAPAFPWFIAGFAALATSLILYEILHAIEHWPFEKWAPRIEHPNPRRARLWRTLYSFHLRHHAVIKCNESISGFFGLPIADWIFRTCMIPRTIYADGEEWKSENFVEPRPCGFIRWLDECATRSVQARRAEKRIADTKTVARGREFTRGEQIADWFTHGVGAAISVAALTLLIVFASMRGDAWHVVSFTVFGLSLLVLYTFSTLYHLSSNERHRWIFRRLDHAAIFLLIAGTFTPFLLTNLRGPWGWTLFGILWGICGATAVYKFFDADRHNIITILGYLFAGWLTIVALKPMLAVVPEPALWLLLAGVLCYAAGVAFFAWLRNMPYQTVVRHSLILGGSVCHILAVLLFLTPAK